MARRGPRSRRLRVPLRRHGHGRRARAPRRAAPRPSRRRRRGRLRARRAGAGRRPVRGCDLAHTRRASPSSAASTPSSGRRSTPARSSPRHARTIRSAAPSSTRPRAASRSHLVPIASVADVSLVVLGGGLGSNGDLLLAPVRRLLEGWIPFPPRVEISSLGEAAVLTGALAVGLSLRSRTSSSTASACRSRSRPNRSPRAGLELCAGPRVRHRGLAPSGRVRGQTPGHVPMGEVRGGA